MNNIIFRVSNRLLCCLKISTFFGFWKKLGDDVILVQCPFNLARKLEYEEKQHSKLASKQKVWTAVFYVGLGI